MENKPREVSTILLIDDDRDDYELLVEAVGFLIPVLLSIFLIASIENKLLI